MAETATRDLDELRRDLMRATLPHAAFDGWTWTAIRAGADDLGIARVEAESAFPEGPAEVIALFSREADIDMIAAAEAHDLAHMRVRDRVALAVRLRLERNEAHREALRRALSLLAMPQHAGLAARLLYDTVDAVWAVAGDASADLNFYSKRALLAGVYSATLLYWLEDRSPEHERTWRFLDRRIDETVKCGSRFGRALQRAGSLARCGARLRPRRRGDLRMRGS